MKTMWDGLSEPLKAAVLEVLEAEQRKQSYFMVSNARTGCRHPHWPDNVYGQRYIEAHSLHDALTLAISKLRLELGGIGENDGERQEGSQRSYSRNAAA